MLYNIITPFCADTGLDPEQQRSTALRFINTGAMEIYKSVEADNLMREVTLIVPKDKQVTLPDFIGQLRGMREVTYTGLGDGPSGYGVTFPLNQIGVPRFTKDGWSHRWRNWTLKGKSPIHTSLGSAGPLTLTVAQVEDIPAVVTITGSTMDSNVVTENVTVNGNVVTTTNSFISILSIISLSTRTFNVVVTDGTGAEIAVLDNRSPKTAYTVVDVSKYGWSTVDGDQTTMVEVLYKVKFIPFENDTDEFGADGYEEAIRYKAMELWLQPQEGKENDCMLAREAAAVAMNLAASDNEMGEDRKISRGKDKNISIMRRLRLYASWNRRVPFGRRWLR